MKNKKTILIINLFIFINTLIITLDGIKNGAGKGQLGNEISGIRYFMPYTIDSNVFLAIAALFLVIALFKEKLSFKTYRFYYVATVSIVLTFLTVVLFLTPSLYLKGGFKAAISLYMYDMTFFHFLNPILACISFKLLNKKKLTTKDNFIAIIPMALYSIVYMLNVLVFKKWNDFYGFTFGGNTKIVPIVLIVMYLVTYLIGLFVRKVLK